MEVSSETQSWAVTDETVVVVALLSGDQLVDPKCEFVVLKFFLFERDLGQITNQFQYVSSVYIGLDLN